MTLLSIENVDKDYGAIKVLKHLTFGVDEGQSFAIIGPNGAGKTTLFKVVTGEAFATAGRVRHAGVDITTMPAFRRAWRGFARTFQVARVYPQFTVLENIVVAIEARQAFPGRGLKRAVHLLPPLDVKNEAVRMAGDLGLATKLHEFAAILSHGDKKRLELASALALQPKILLMDEPTAGMSPADRVATVTLIKDIRARLGLTILLTEHDMDVVFGLADRVMVLNYGEAVTIDSPEAVRADPAVRKLYLGETMHA